MGGAVRVEEVVAEWRRIVEGAAHAQMRGLMEGAAGGALLDIDRQMGVRRDAAGGGVCMEDAHAISFATRMIGVEGQAAAAAGGGGAQEAEEGLRKEALCKLARVEERLRESPLAFVRAAVWAIRERHLAAAPSILARAAAVPMPSGAPMGALLTVAVYSARRPSVCMQRLDVSPDASLGDVARAIFCVLTRLLPAAASTRPPPAVRLEGPAAPPLGAARSAEPAFFCIEDVFYATAAADGGRRGGVDVEEARWGAIALAVGKAYPFVHCGGECEHYIVVEGIRCRHPYDALAGPVPARSAPAPALVRETYSARKRRKRCRLCEARHATWIVAGDRLAPDNPCPMCDACHRMLHYVPCGEGAGALLYEDFALYPYHCDL